ncbi:hypothetical protein P245_25485 [Comamonas thiooxydans]|uniref:Uncharacterized protein n=1 Tax=Comamonas thiooxydans TaxID=363952 RepID=A0A0E3BDM8_9BURK|nr:hypothetical protein P245_25485 [Comamonas thiooxydans]
MTISPLFTYQITDKKLDIKQIKLVTVQVQHPVIKYPQ